MGNVERLRAPQKKLVNSLVKKKNGVISLIFQVIFEPLNIVLTLICCVSLACHSNSAPLVEKVLLVYNNII